MAWPAGAHAPWGLASDWRERTAPAESLRGAGKGEGLWNRCSKTGARIGACLAALIEVA